MAIPPENCSCLRCVGKDVVEPGKTTLRIENDGPPGPRGRAGAEYIASRPPQGCEALQWLVRGSAPELLLHLLPFPPLEGARLSSEDLVITIEPVSVARARGAVESQPVVEAADGRALPNVRRA